MKRKRAIKITKISLIVFAVLLLMRIVFVDSIVIEGRCDMYVDDYDEYYLYKNVYKPTFSFSFGTGGFRGHKLWFLPGKKAKLLEKIKGEVIAELEDVVENNPDVFKEYDISDDFRKIYIYYYKNTDVSSESYRRFSKLGNDLTQKTVALKVELYHQLIHGAWKTGFNGNIVDIIEIDSINVTK